MEKSTDFADDLKRSGLKNTKHRTAILNILERSDQPMTAEQVFYELGGEKISASLSTVYRALDSLVFKNLITKLIINGNSKALFEYNRMGHRHHLICLGCKKIRAIERCPLKNYEESLEKETDFSISGHKLDIYGYCPECRKNAAVKPT